MSAANDDDTAMYAEADKIVREHVKGSTYGYRKHSHREVMKHGDHSVDMSEASGVQAICCHTCKIMVAY